MKGTDIKRDIQSFLEIHGCAIHTNGGHRINYNANGIIIYDYYYEIGSYDVWYIRQLISYSNK